MFSTFVRNAAVVGLLSASVVGGAAGVAEASTATATTATVHAVAAPAKAPANLRQGCGVFSGERFGVCQQFGSSFPLGDSFWSGGGSFWSGYGDDDWCPTPYGYGGPRFGYPGYGNWRGHYWGHGWGGHRWGGHRWGGRTWGDDD